MLLWSLQSLDLNSDYAIHFGYKLAAEPDWEFMRENQSKLAFLFGIDDHWGPLHLFEEVSRFPRKYQLNLFLKIDLTET